MAKLTKTFIDKVQPPAEGYAIHWDDSLKGYGLRVTADFQRTYTRYWNERAAPETARKLKAVQGAKAMIEERAGLVFKELEKAVGAPPHKAAALRQAKTNAEKAFILQDLGQ
jgi:hypothetical protein